MDSVRAKFKCNSVEHMEGGYKKANFRAVTSGSDENKDFCEATPNGDLSIMISSGRAAQDFFEPGECYYLDFSKAPK